MKMDVTMMFYITYAVIVVESLVLMLARRDIMFFFKCKMKKRKGYGIVMEMRSNKTIDTSIQKIGERSTVIKDRTYLTNPSDICLELGHQMPCVVVNEGTAKSVGFEEAGIASAQELSSLVTQAKRIGAMGNSSLQKWAKIAVYAGAVLIIVMIYLAYTQMKGQATINQILALVQGIKAGGTVVI
jgi:hypothetical protein